MKCPKCGEDVIAAQLRSPEGEYYDASMCTVCAWGRWTNERKNKEDGGVL